MNSRVSCKLIILWLLVIAGVHVNAYTPCSVVDSRVNSVVVKSDVSTSVVVDFCGVDSLHCTAVELALRGTVDVSTG
mgnify:CR=1 FL=1